MPSQMTAEIVRIDGCKFVCELPSPAVRLAVENGCVVAYLEDGDKFLVPVECHQDEVKN